MEKEKQHRHLGAYGLLIVNNKILLINKNGGPYDGKLDLPGGSIEMYETPLEALKRELQEEVGIIVSDCSLFDANSVSVMWYKQDERIRVHHIGIFYQINQYEGTIQSQMEITKDNDDSLGADFYDIDVLRKSQLSEIAIMELEKYGFNLHE